MFVRKKKLNLCLFCMYNLLRQSISNEFHRQTRKNSANSGLPERVVCGIWVTAFSSLIKKFSADIRTSKCI